MKDSEKEDVALFRKAVADAKPLRAAARITPAVRKLPPVPIRSYLDDQEVLAESGSEPSLRDDFTGEEETYLRQGMAPDVLRKLRRLQWKIQAELSVRRLTQPEAHAALVLFLRECVEHGHRCVRIVHGKGMQSPNREPVLKGKVKVWLARRDEVLAFCQAPPQAGGGGALLVLLKP